jgi:uracil-DNA glycosylase family 4
MLGQSRLEKMKILEEQIQNCNRCGLCHSRRKAVLGEGNIESPLAFVGEAPGRKEDETGRPFVGSAGRLLDRLLSHIGLDRHEVYITNVVKCRPPGNRRPKSGEVRSCTPYLDEQLTAISPQVIAPMGNSATAHLLRRFGLERASIGEIHGRAIDVEAPWGRAVLFPLYHPAAVLYNRELEAELTQDFESLRALLDLERPS